MNTSPPLQIGSHAEPPSNPIVPAILAHMKERRLQPGDRLPSERALAGQLGVGRNALREALATLATLRVVEAKPNSGIYLRRVATESSFETLVLLADMGTSPTPIEIVETMEVRATLELLAVKLACERAEDKDLERIEAVLDHTDALLREGGNISDDDTAFHLALIEATHNGVLVRVLNSFYRKHSVNPCGAPSGGARSAGHTCRFSLPYSPDECDGVRSRLERING